MKRITPLLICALLSVPLASCSKSGPAADAKKLASETLALYDATAAKLEKAANAKQAADALLFHAVEMKKLNDRTKAFQAKYPDFRKYSSAADSELQSSSEKSAAAFSSSVSRTMMKYSGSPEMLDAIMKMSELTKTMK